MCAVIYSLYNKNDKQVVYTSATQLQLACVEGALFEEKKNVSISMATWMDRDVSSLEMQMRIAAFKPRNRDGTSVSFSFRHRHRGHLRERARARGWLAPDL